MADNRRDKNGKKIETKNWKGWTYSALSEWNNNNTFAMDEKIRKPTFVQIKIVFPALFCVILGLNLALCYLLCVRDMLVFLWTEAMLNCPV